jgi:hypothetical protein
MALTLTERDKEIIQMCDLQVGQLIDKKAPDYVILNTLIELIPEAKCLMNSVCEKQLYLYCKEYRNFDYLVQLIANL